MENGLMQMDDEDNHADEFLASMSRNVDMQYEHRITLPGDDVTSYVTGLTKSINIGQGLYHDKSSDRVISRCSGVLKYHVPNYYWIETNRNRYYPRVNDQVIGVIEDKGGDYYVVNIYSGSHCILNRLSFEGATKRHKPELSKGDVIYTRVVSTPFDSDVELSCITSSFSGSKKEWSTNETVYGPLLKGLVVKVPITYAYKLLQPESVLWSKLEKHFAYEVAIGMNGGIWFRIQDDNIINTIVIRNAIINAQYFHDDIQVIAMVDQLIEASKHIKH